jgi:spore germination protein KB
MERIGLYQLAAIIILFQIGSSPLFLLASEAKQDAWLAVLIAMLCGLGLLAFVTLAIQKQEPEKNLIEILIQYLGKPAGLSVAWLYVIYFIYKSVRNVREFGDLMIQYLLPESPLTVITGILMLVSCYTVFKGVEVFFRVSEILLPILAGIYLFMVMLLIIVGLIQLNQLLPVLPEGIKPVLSAAIPEVISFPFGEMVLFLMFWKYTENKEKLQAVTLSAYCMSGIFLTCTSALIICIIGPALGGAGGIPLMLAASMIQIAGIVERMDPFVAILLFLGVLMKQTAYYLGAALAVGSIFRISYRKMLLPVGLAIYVGSLLFKSYMQQIWFGFEYNVKYHFPVLQMAIPLVLLLVMKLRGMRDGNLSGGVKHGKRQEVGDDEAPAGNG